MAERTVATLTFLDSYGKTTTRQYQSRAANPGDADVQALATVAQEISALSVTKAQVTREVDISGITTAAETKSSRQKDASLKYQKSALRNSHPGPYTFNIPEPKAALMLANGNIDTTEGVWADWSELFDDGAGVAAVVGNWYVSDGEELVEEQPIIDGFFNKR